MQSEEAFHLFKKIYCPILVVHGIVGSILVITALWRYKLAPKSTTVLLSLLLLNNLLFLVLFMPVIYLFETWSIRLHTSSKAFCFIFVHGVTLIPYLQSNYQILLSVERCIVVALPLRAKRLLSRRRVIIVAVITSLCLFGVSATSYTRVQYVAFGNNTYCIPGEIGNKEAFYLNLVFWQTLPIVLMSVNNIVIIVTLFCRKRENVLMLRRNSSSSGNHRRLTLTLVMMTVVFCLFTLPSTAKSIVQGDYSGEILEVPVWLQHLRWLTFRNTFITDWIILLVMSTKIRQGVGRIIGFKYENRRTTLTTLAHTIPLV